MKSTLEWMLANRYLRRTRMLPLTGLVVAAVALWLLFGLLVGAKSYFEHRARFYPTVMWYESTLRYAIAGTLVAAQLVLFFAWLARRFTIFAAISIFGLFLGTAALVVVLSVMSGFEQDLRHKILGANAHVLVTAPDQQFADYAEVAKRIHGVKGVESVSPYISNEVMISSQSNLAGVILKGIDPGSAAVVTDLAKNMEQGSLDNLAHPEKLRDLPSPIDDLELDEARAAVKKQARVFQAENGKPPKAEPESPPEKRAPRRVLPGVIIGRELAKNLRLFLGDDVNVISPMGDIGPTGAMPRSRSFRVAGIFYSGMYEYDTKHIYLSIPAAQKFLGTDDEVTGVEVRVTDPDRTEPVVAAIQANLKDHSERFDVQDWKELNRNLFSALKIEKVAMFVVLCFVILVAGFSIIANGIMLVREKEREIAILKSMGATDRTVLRTFLLMGLAMGVIGIGYGILTGILNCVLLARYGLSLDTDVYYIAKLPIRMNPIEIIAVFGAANLIALCATIYPALVAARMKPVEGLRYDHG